MKDSKTRLVHDTMGELSVPITALYGAQTQRAINNFNISELRMPIEIIHALALIKSACAEINSDLGLIDSTIAEAISAAAMKVFRGEYDDQFTLDVFQTGSGTSTNMNVNEVIAKLASDEIGTQVHANDHVNKGQSSNDVIPSAIHISASLAIKNHLHPALSALVVILDDMSEQYSDIVKTGRTHLMDAMPLTLGQELSAWGQQIRLNQARLQDCLPRLYELAIGGTAVGTGVNTPQSFASHVISRLSEKSEVIFRPKANYFEALSCQDTSLELSGILKTSATSMMKISNDLRWMSSGPNSGLNEITLPKLQPGSSIMPGKVNPVIPEAVSMACAQIMGNDACITIAAQSGNFQLNVMLPVIAYNLLQSINILAGAARALVDKALPFESVNEDQLKIALLKSPVLVTALVPHIGYEKAFEIAKVATEQNKSIIELARMMTDIADDELTRILSAKNLCAPLS